VSEADEERAVELHLELLEVLRLLNRAEVERSGVEGLEHRELLTLLRRGPCPFVTPEGFDRAIDTLLGNRMIRELDDLEYAWDRGRTVGRRYALALEGKEYLLEDTQKSGRIQ
jgi:hypothetical protein